MFIWSWPQNPSEKQSEREATVGAEVPEEAYESAEDTFTPDKISVRWGSKGSDFPVQLL